MFVKIDPCDVTKRAILCLLILWSCGTMYATLLSAILIPGAIFVVFLVFFLYKGTGSAETNQHKVLVELDFYWWLTGLRG